MSIQNGKNHNTAGETLDEKRDALKNGTADSISTLEMRNTSIPTSSENKSTDKSIKMSSMSMRRSESYGQMSAASEANVLVIYTGGTIGMVRNENNGQCDSISFSFFFLSTLTSEQTVKPNDNNHIMGWWTVSSYENKI